MFESFSSAVMWTVCLWRVELELFSREAFKAAALSIADSRAKSSGLSVEMLETKEADLRAIACLQVVRDIAEQELKAQLELQLLPTTEQVSGFSDVYLSLLRRQAAIEDHLSTRTVGGDLHHYILLSRDFVCAGTKYAHDGNRH
jgi:hypothetical protein